jgi:N-acetylglutamate synthase-like GNAT family acetyltransferase
LKCPDASAVQGTSHRASIQGTHEGRIAIVGNATPEDSAAILDLLQVNRLPLDGLTEHLATAVVAREEGRIVGSAVLEMYGSRALLRSVAVSPAFQSRGLGRALIEAIRAWLGAL